MFMGLGDFAGGSFNSQAFGVSADGAVVVGAGVDASGQIGFRWTQAGGMVALPGFQSGSGAVAFGVSADGSVAVGRASGLAVRWTTGGLVALQRDDVPQFGFGGNAYGASGDGSIIVGDRQTSGTTPNIAFRWTAATGAVFLGDLQTTTSDRSRANAISADGSVIVGQALAAFGSSLKLEAFRWTSSGGMEGLGFTQSTGNNSGAFAVTPDGSVIVGFSSAPGQQEAFRWTQATGIVGLGSSAVDIMPLGASGVSADGSVIIGQGLLMSSPSTIDAFIWDAVHGARRLKSVLENDYGLDLSGWDLVNPTGISADGRTIVGRGTSANGQEAWIAQLGPASSEVPEPSSMMLLAMGTMVLVGYGWRQKITSTV
jgi:probable HAF family extracellular repeat protein